MTFRKESIHTFAHSVKLNKCLLDHFLSDPRQCLILLYVFVYISRVK